MHVISRKALRVFVQRHPDSQSALDAWLSRNVENMTIATPEQLTQAWSRLQALVPLTAIHTEQHYDRAVVALNMLVDTAGMDDQHALADLLDTLGTLIQTYEEQHEAESVPTNTTILQFFMTEHDLTPADLIELGEPSVVQNVLAGKLSLTPPQLHVLARRFDVVPETFISVR